jgi:hypothetical protein
MAVIDLLEHCAEDLFSHMKLDGIFFGTDLNPYPICGKWGR